MEWDVEKLSNSKWTKKIMGTFIVSSIIII